GGDVRVRMADESGLPRPQQACDPELPLRIGGEGMDVDTDADAGDARVHRRGPTVCPTSGATAPGPTPGPVPPGPTPGLSSLRRASCSPRSRSSGYVTLSASSSPAPATPSQPSAST